MTPTPAPESSAPQTGDTTNLVIWVVILCIGAACLTVTLDILPYAEEGGPQKIIFTGTPMKNKTPAE